MNRLLIGLGLWFAAMPPCRATELPGEWRVANDGFVRTNAARGETTWTGTMTIDYPRFHLAARGTASLFGGPAIHRMPAQDRPLQTAKFTAKTQWISMVVLGAITITVRDKNGDSMPFTAQRVVYLPAEDRLLIDGKPW